MQLLAKMKRKDSTEKTHQSIKAVILPTADSKAPHTTPRSAFHIFVRSISSGTSPASSPDSSSPSSPSTPAATLPSHAPHPHSAVAPAPTITSSARPRQRQLVRVPSILYCPVLEKDGKGYGNEKARRTTAL